MGRDHALEVACGQCHVTRSLLVKHFAKIDLMDRSPEAIMHAEQLRAESKRIGAVSKATMQEFKPTAKYNCIVLRYCIGYLNDVEAVDFLSRLGQSLVSTPASQPSHGAELTHTQDRQPSYLLVQDQAVPENDDEFLEDGQRVRKESSL